ncbi:hypothetical protein TNCV_2246881 [Trichonephila clavipes]|nr:hypothetical protein TNCV_2246881 [Trichonephila clavipes]
MPTTRAMEAQFQILLEKLTEMKSDLTSMNANMGEMKSELTASMSANMDELNNKLTANKEELKSDLKGIGDKLTTMDKKFEEMEGRIESVENKFENKTISKIIYKIIYTLTYLYKTMVKINYTIIDTLRIMAIIWSKPVVMNDSRLRIR